MTTLSSIDTPEKSITLFSDWFRREPMLARFTLGVLGLIPLLMVAAAVDHRTLNGINIWIKPLKFNVAIALYLGTLVWFSGWIDRSVMQRNWYRLYIFVLCGTLVILLPWLYAAAIMGEPAHYNRTHPILAPLYSLMGVVSVLLTAGTLMVAGLIASNKRSPLSTYFRSAVVLSLIISFVFVVVLAGELASMDSHWIGGTPTDKHGLWLFGWSRDGGDLRVAHFFALHAMHFIPLAALITLPRPLTNHPRITATVVSLLYSVLILSVYFQAKQGQPFLAWLG